MNLLLISVDSLRLDFAPGISAKVHTPNFCDLARDYHISEHCFSISSATRPVHTSLFSGLYPFEHGIEGQQSPAMRQGFANLFDLCQQDGYAVHGFSQAADIFTGLHYARYIAPFPTSPQAITQLTHTPNPTVLFLHYWDVHTPYGATDGLAFGEVGRLLAAGRLDLIHERYIAAIERLFEFNISPILAGLDLDKWSVFIISDHGESWRSDEPYHGQSLRNDVLRVPLYYHIPGSGNPSPGRQLISLIDLFPTLLAQLGLRHTYRGFARDIHDSDTPGHYLAEIDPGPLAEAAEGSAGPTDLFPANTFGRQWALFDPVAKFTYDETTLREEFVSTFSEFPLAAPDDKRSYHRAYADFKASSNYADADFSQGADRDILLDRLQKLGYLQG